jgi:uncharacterized membrane-anchored protein
MGVKTENEFFPGFGKKEFVQALVGTLFGGLAAVIVYFVSGNMAYTMIAVLTGIAGSVMMVTKDQYNMSVVTQVANLVRFSRSQKVYPYVYGKEWGAY